MVVIGQRVHCILYGGRDGTIVNIIGEQQPASVRQIGGVMLSGGNAEFDIVWDDGTTSKLIPESLLYSVQWRVYDEVYNDIQISSAKANAQIHTVQCQIAKENKEKRQAEERARIRQENRHLEQGNDCWSGKLAAVNIRKELKKAFPKIKFSVRKTHYGSLNIGWTNGPKTAEVSKITNKYLDGHFNGMEDIYKSNDNNVWPSVFGGAKYIFHNRGHSDAVISQAIQSVWTKWADDEPMPTVEDYHQGRTYSIHLKRAHNDAQQMIWKELQTL